jgi:hypothetical protein
MQWLFPVFATGRGVLVDPAPHDPRALRRWPPARPRLGAPVRPRHGYAAAPQIEVAAGPDQAERPRRAGFARMRKGKLLPYRDSDQARLPVETGYMQMN